MIDCLIRPFACAVALSPLLLAVGCGAGASSTTPAKAPEGAEPAGDTQREQAPAEEGGMAPQPSPPAAAGAPMPGSTRSNAAEGESPSSLGDFDGLGRQLEGALALSAPNCTLAWALRDQICDLSQRLCDLAARSAEPEMVERCDDGRARCERATARVRAGCSE